MTTRVQTNRPAILLCVVLLVAIGGIGGVGWRLWASEIDVSPAPPKPGWTSIDLTELEQQPERFRSKPLTAYRQTTERPLFSSTRRPPKSEPVAVEVKQEPKPPSHIPIGQLQLAGVIVTLGDKRALIKSPSAPDGAWYTEDETVGGWKILEIRRNFTSLGAGNSQEKLRLYVENVGITSE